jgi:hypothetical protein
MADEIVFDFSALGSLAANLGDAPKGTEAKVRKAVEVSARNVKDTWAKKLAGSAQLPMLGRSVTYDVTGGKAIRAAEITADIGPDKDRPQGPLGNFSEFGKPGQPGRGYGLASLKETEEDYVRGIEIAVDDGLKGSGL